MLGVAAATLASVSPAWAQSNANPGDSGQDSTSASAPSAAAEEEILVTGIRASLASAREFKRNSESILDAIVAEDIGKLPDNNASESLARLPGVQVNRYADEASGILIRGLPDVGTSFNGREIFTAENRTVQVHDFPAGALAALEVYKSATAELIEPGLAGLVNVRSRRPFDFKGLEIAGAIRASYNDQSKKTNPNGNLLISDRWNTPIGEMGALVNVAYNRFYFNNAIRYTNGGVDPVANSKATLPAGQAADFRLPYSVGLYYPRGLRERPSVNGSFQWKPAHNLEIYVDGLWQAYRNQGSTESFDVSLLRAAPKNAAGVEVPPNLFNIVRVDGQPNKLVSISKTGGYPAETFRSTTRDYTNTYQAAGGFVWTTGRAVISSDFAYTFSEYGNNESSLDGQTAAAPPVNVIFEKNKSSWFDLGNYDMTNPANYVWRGFYQKEYYVTGAGIQWRGDVALETDVQWLPKIKFGLRATDRDAKKRQGNRYAYTPTLSIPLASLPTGNLEQVQDGFRGDGPPFRNWLMPSYDAIQSNAEALRQLSYASLQKIVAANPNDQGYKDALAKFATQAIPMDPYGGFYSKESSYAAYAQGSYAFDVGIPIDGSFGVRIVNTDGRYVGTSKVTVTDPVTKVDTVTSVTNVNRQNYVDVLPSFGLRAKLMQGLQARLGFTMTRTRPSFGDLNPAFTISRNTDFGTGTGSNARYAAFGSGGNPDLKPLTSKNYDATIEYYFGRNGAVSGALFYRDLKGFISSYTRDVNDPTFGLIQVSRPENAGTGKIKGFEVSAQSFFDFLPGWLSGFGAQANLTYVDAKNQLPKALGEARAMVPLTGLSKWTYNLGGFYERDKVSLRVSYNYRSSYVDFYSRNSNDAAYTGQQVRPISRLDFSGSYTPVENITLTVEVNNILAQPFSNYRYFNESQYYPIDTRYEGRYFSAGVRFRF
ncbi:TonB-dependent receptor [uncultured Sphingomonas sp.]|uniref:TonB-dependent receptor n=1 Tax=uncultured Sphingomonas sp. TaxID=158754 RepID=UPI0025FF97AE|nr:TonB-dependent receptor [uncultured Sphingomonas sp.]